MGNRIYKSAMEMALHDISQHMKSSELRIVSYYGENGKLNKEVWFYGVGKMAKSKKIKKLNNELGLKSINLKKRK